MQGLELVEESEWNTIFRLDTPLGNFKLPLQMFVYFGNVAVGQNKIALSFTVQPKFPEFFVNGKHSLSICSLGDDDESIYSDKLFSKINFKSVGGL